MTNRKSLTPEEISAIVNGFDPIDLEEIEMVAKLPPGERWLVGYRKSEAMRADLREKLKKEFPELSEAELNMKILRSLTSVRMGKSYTEPAYHEHFG
ncbi:MAG: hypothetical protein AB1750_19525 [Chloroflexota bacterium]